MNTQNKEESQGACSDSSAEVVAYGRPDIQPSKKNYGMVVRPNKGQDGCTIPLIRQSAYLALQEKVKELEAELVSEHGWANHYSKLVVGLTAKLESADIVIKGLRGTIDKQAKESSKLLDRLEAKDAEPVATIRHNKFGEYALEPHEGFNYKTLPVGVEFNLYTTPPTVSAAVAAFKRKAADVCRASADGVHLSNSFKALHAVSDEILAIPADDTALREMLMKVAKAAWEPDVVQDSDLEAIVNRVIKGE